MPLLRLVLALALVGLAAAEFELEYITGDDHLEQLQHYLSGAVRWQGREQGAHTRTLKANVNTDTINWRKDYVGAQVHRSPGHKTWLLTKCGWNDKDLEEAAQSAPRCLANEEKYTDGMAHNVNEYVVRGNGCICDASNNCKMIAAYGSSQTVVTDSRSIQIEQEGMIWEPGHIEGCGSQSAKVPCEKFQWHQGTLRETFKDVLPEDRPFVCCVKHRDDHRWYALKSTRFKFVDAESEERCMVTTTWFPQELIDDADFPTGQLYDRRVGGYVNAAALIADIEQRCVAKGCTKTIAEMRDEIRVVLAAADQLKRCVPAGVLEAHFSTGRCPARGEQVGDILCTCEMENMPLVEQLPAPWQLVAIKYKGPNHHKTATVYIKPGAADVQKIEKIAAVKSRYITRKEFKWIVDE